MGRSVFLSMTQALVQSSASDSVVHLTTIMHVKVFFKIATCMFSTKENEVSKVDVCAVLFVFNAF